MKLGMIARADNTGLGIQSWEFHRHMKPDRTLIIDVGHLADDGQHCNKTTYRDRYPADSIVFEGWSPPSGLLAHFLDGLDAVFTAESPYNYALFSLAERMGIHTVLQYNWEFLDHIRRRDLPAPSLFAAPSTWHYSDLQRPNKMLLPVPIAMDRFIRTQPRREHATHFVHLVGRPAIHDRNGTSTLLAALGDIRSEVTVTLKCQEPGYLGALIGKHFLESDVKRVGNVTLVIDSTPVENYWDNYTTGDVLVMPRRFGGLCLPVQEALAAGMPVIMPAILPNTDWLPAEWLIPAIYRGNFDSRSTIDLYSASPSALAAKIDHFATDPAFYAEAVEKADAIAHWRSWAALKPEYDRALTPG